MSTDLTSLIADSLHNEGDGGIWESFDRANAEKVTTVLAAAIEASDWLAEHDREVAAAAVEAAADEFAEGAWEDAFAAGHVEDDISAIRATDAWLRARAQAIREGRR